MTDTQECIKQLEPLGVKFTTDVTPETTCYLRSVSAMTSKGLLAVALGKPIVGIDYVQALGQRLFDPNTIDLQTGIPDPLQFVRDSTLAPDTRRRELYLGKTFVFWDKDMYEQILPVIEACGGKAALQYPTDNLTVKTIADFIEETAFTANDCLGTRSKAVLSGSVIPVKLLIEAPDVEATSLLVNTNNATKALGVCLMGQHMFSESIKAVSNRHMFRLRPSGPMPELLKAPEPVSRTSSKITDFFSASGASSGESSARQTPEVPRSKPKPAAATSQIPRKSKPSQPLPKLENPFFQTGFATTAAAPQAATLPAKKTPGSFISKPKPKTQPRADDTQTPDILAFFSQAPTPAANRQGGVTQKIRDEATEPVADTAAKRDISTVLSTPLEEATESATKSKKQKLDHDGTAAEADAEAEAAAAAAVEIQELVDDEMPEEILKETAPSDAAKGTATAAVPLPKLTFAEALRKTKQEQVDQHDYNTLGGSAGDSAAGEFADGLRNLAIVEESVVLRPTSQSASGGEINSNAQWSNRPNFKKFRRSTKPGANGVSTASPSAGGRLVSHQVMLVEVNPHQMRIENDVEWLQNDPKNQRYRPPSGAGVETPAEPAPAAVEDSLFMGSDDEDEEEDEEVEMLSFRNSVSASRSASMTPGPCTGSASSGDKRVPVAPAPRARARPVTVDDDDDDDDNDGLGFRFSK